MDQEKCREEHKELMAEGDETLKGTRQLWLYNPENFNPEQRQEFAGLKDLHLKVARAWAAKELFSQFWNYRGEGWARRFFKQWFGWVSRSRLKPVVEVARMLTRVRKHGQSTDRTTGNIVAATFRHDTSRALDPHLHTHCIVFNATYDSVECRWKALQNHDILVAQKSVTENVYYQ